MRTLLLAVLSVSLLAVAAPAANIASGAPDTGYDSPAPKKAGKRKAKAKAKKPKVFQGEAGAGMVVAIQPGERKITVKTRKGELVQFSVDDASALSKGANKKPITFEDIQVGDPAQFALRGSLATAVHIGSGVLATAPKKKSPPKKKPKPADDWDDESFRVVIDKDTDSPKEKDREEEDAVEPSSENPEDGPPKTQAGGVEYGKDPTQGKGYTPKAPEEIEE